MENHTVKIEPDCDGARLILLGIWIDSGIFQDQVKHRGTESTEQSPDLKFNKEDLC